MTITSHVNQNDNLTTANNKPATSIDSVFAVSEVSAELEKHGLSGLTFDHASFPTISLKSSFEMSSDATFELKTFDVNVMRTMEKYLLVDAMDRDNNTVFYSRDGVTSVTGESFADLSDAIASQGGQPVIKRYLDVLCIMRTNDKYNGKVVVLSISPTSVSRVSGVFYQLKLQGQLDQLATLKLTVSRGVQRTSKNGNTYYLWSVEPAEIAQAA